MHNYAYYLTYSQAFFTCVKSGWDLATRSVNERVRLFSTISHDERYYIIVGAWWHSDQNEPTLFHYIRIDSKRFLLHVAQP